MNDNIPMLQPTVLQAIVCVLKTTPPSRNPADPLDHGRSIQIPRKKHLDNTAYKNSDTK